MEDIVLFAETAPDTLLKNATTGTQLLETAVLTYALLNKVGPVKEISLQSAPLTVKMVSWLRVMKNVMIRMLQLMTDVMMLVPKKMAGSALTILNLQVFVRQFVVTSCLWEMSIVTMMTTLMILVALLIAQVSSMGISVILLE